MRKLFYPDSVVVVGVANTPNNLGRNMVMNLFDFGFKGRIYAVGLEDGSVNGVPIVRSIAELPEAPDLAAILTPARTLPGVIRDCGEKGTKHAAILSAGFTEYSEDRRALQEELIATAKHYGVRFVGPNGMGIVCPESGLALPFAPIALGEMKHGPLTMLSQSGSISFLTGWIATHEGPGLAKFVSMGNKFVLDEVELLPYFMYEDDPTKIIGLYLEGTARGREFVQLARRSPKPIVALKANISKQVEHAARSHTASLASDDRVVEGAFRQAGITRVFTVRQLCSTAKMFTMPLMRGDNIGIIGSTGGVEVIATDFSLRYGFKLPPLSKELEDTLHSYARANVIRLNNPIDMGDVFDNTGVLRTVELMLAQPDIDGMAASLFHRPASFPGPDTITIINRIAELVQQLQKPLALTFMARPAVIAELRQQTSFPIFNDIEECMAGLNLLRQYARFRAKPQSEPATFAVDKDAAAKIVAGARRDGLQDIGPAAMDLLAAYGISTADLHFAASAQEAAQAAEKLGYPVVLKAVAKNLTHKSDLGGVALNLHDADDVRQAFASIEANLKANLPEAPFAGVVVQPMVSGGHEFILGAKHDEHYGPVVMFGLGGIFAEVFQDVAFRLAPLSKEDALDLINDVKGARILEGLRGQPPADVPALVEALQRLGQLIADHEEIKEIDINPIKVFPQGQGAIAVDARVVVKA